MTGANQHIEVDGDILRNQVSRIREVSADFAAAASTASHDLPGHAFGILNQGIVIPLANAVAARSRDLLDTAQKLADRVADGADAAVTAFSTVEEDAVSTFSGTDE